MLHADQRTKQRRPVNERLRPVERIENPPKPGRARRLAEFLAEHPVVRKVLRDPLPNRLLSPPIRDRHWRGIALAFDVQSGVLIEAEDDPRSIECRIAGEFQTT